MTVMAFDPTRTRNARAIADAATLGFLNGTVCDLTHNAGRFWQQFTPDRLVRCDIDPTMPVDVVCDCGATPFPDDTFDATVFDPPYKLNGTGGSCAEDAGYGVADGWDTRRDIFAAGITEAARITRRGGYVLVKCQDQIAGGWLVSQSAHVLDVGRAVGLREVGRLLVCGVTRGQPAGRPQRSPRNNVSTLHILRSTG